MTVAVKRDTTREEAAPFSLAVVAAVLESELPMLEEEEEEDAADVVVALVDFGTLLILLVLFPKSKELHY